MGGTWDNDQYEYLMTWWARGSTLLGNRVAVGMVVARWRYGEPRDGGTGVELVGL